MTLKLSMSQESFNTLLIPSPGHAVSPVCPVTVTCIKTWSILFTVLSSLPISDVKLKELRDLNSNDPTTQMLHQYSLQGWPAHKCDVHPSLKSFWDVRNDIHVADGILLKDNRLVIPSPWKKDIL